jgi:hypothetical protein
MNEIIDRQIAELQNSNKQLGDLLAQVYSEVQKNKKDTQAQIDELKSELQDARTQMRGLGN